MEVVNVLGKDDGDDHVASSHADSTDDENGLPANTIDPQDYRDGCNEHGNAHDTSCEETRRVGTQAQLIKDLGGIVEDLVEC